MMYKLGIDIGSTTAKLVVQDENKSVVYSKYTRHNADVACCVADILLQAASSYKTLSQ